MRDRVLLEVLSNRFMGIARELGHIIKTAGHTVFVKETADFGAYLVSRRGEVFMTPDDMGIFITIGTPMDGAIEAIPDYDPGDICITNDPEGSRGLVTHLPDFFLWKPVFAGGRLICFCFSFIHSTDVGGLVPGSVSPTAVDQFASCSAAASSTASCAISSSPTAASRSRTGATSRRRCRRSTWPSAALAS
jgi:N-methylhydantoinase B